MPTEATVKNSSATSAETRRKYQEYVITSLVKRIEPVVPEHARGAVITDADGREFIDCFSGISVVNSGHCHPEVVAAIEEQARKLLHCCSYVYHSQPTADLAEKLAQLTPGRLKKTFFANSGAEALEGAMKLAKLYTGRHEFIALDSSFHGRTLATLSITGNQARKRRGGPYMPGITFVPAPYTYRAQYSDPEQCVDDCVRALEDAIRFRTSGDVAAFIAEPVMGEGGIIVPPRSYFKKVKAVLDQHKILFIADEVQSGFGRCGTMFAIEPYGVEPDILCTAKGIAAGMPLGGFTTRDEIADAFQPGDHLSTFGGNPVSCAAALANINVLERDQLPQRAAKLGAKVQERLRGSKNKYVGEVRGAGLMIGIELVGDQVKKTPAAAQADSVRAACLEQGLLVGVGGVYGNVVRLQPPLVISEQQLDHALTTMEEALAAL